MVDKNTVNSFKWIKVPPVTYILLCVASLLGCGAVFDGQSTGGHWSTEESLVHINVLELKTVLCGVKLFF